MKKILTILILGMFLISLISLVDAGISRSGTRTTITGYKYSGTIDSTGSTNGVYWFNSTAFGTLEQNIVASGTVNGDCIFNDGAGNRETVEDSGASFMSVATSSQVIKQTTDNIYSTTPGVFTNTNVRTQANIFRNYGCNDGYEIYSWIPSPSSYLNTLDGNIVIITSGDGVGQVRAIKFTGENRTYLYGSWETTPAQGDSFVIAWSHADIVKANAAAGTITYKDSGRQIGFVEITDNLRIGDGVTETWFGYAGYSVSMSNIYPEGTGWTSVHRRYANSNTYYGEWNPKKRTVGYPAYMLNYGRSAYSTGCMAEYSSTTPDNYIYGSNSKGSTWCAGFGGAGTETAWSRINGNELSYHNLGVTGDSVDSQGAWFTYGSGNWGAPWWSGTFAYNYIVRDAIGEVVSGGAVGAWGLGWEGANTGSPGQYWIKWVDNNWNLNDFKKDGVLCDWFFFDSAYNMDESMFWAKSFNIKVIDSNGNPIENATVDIKNYPDDTITYLYSGSNITEDLTSAETGIDVTYGDNFSVGDIIKIDQEYINVTSISTNTLTVTRAVRYSHGFQASEHYQSSLGYNPKIYRITTVTTDSTGKIPEQDLEWGYWTTRAHQVYHNGAYYTTKKEHIANSSTEPGVGADWATYWNTTGDMKVAWEVDKRYAPGFAIDTYAKYSINELQPYTLTITTTGGNYFTHTQNVDVSIDSEGVDWTIKLYKWYELEGVAYIVMDKVNNLIKFYKNG